MIRFINKGGGIDTSDATATEDDILSPETAYVNGKKITGTVDLSNLTPENVKVGVTIDKVTGNYTEDATATANDILKPKTVYVNGEKVEGAIEAQYETRYGSGKTVTKNIIPKMSGTNNSYSGAAISADGIVLCIFIGTSSSCNIYVYILENNEYTLIKEESINKSCNLGSIDLYSLGFAGNKDCVGISISNSSIRNLYNIKTKSWLDFPSNLNIEGSHEAKTRRAIYNNIEYGLSTAGTSSFYYFVNITNNLRSTYQIKILESNDGYSRYTHDQRAYSDNIFGLVTYQSNKNDNTICGRTRLIYVDWNNADSSGSVEEYTTKVIENIFIPSPNLDYVVEGLEIKKLTMNSGTLEYNTISLDKPIYLPVSNTDRICNIIWINSNLISFQIYGNDSKSDEVYIYYIDYDQGTITLQNTGYSSKYYGPHIHSNNGELVCAWHTKSDIVDNIEVKYTEDTKQYEKLENFKVSGNTYSYIGDSTGEASDLRFGKTMYNRQGLIQGTMPDNGELNYTPSIEEQKIPGGYTSGGTISAVTFDIDSNIIPENIKEGVTILGVTGTYTGEAPQEEEG